MFGTVFENWMYADWKMLMATNAIASAREYVKGEEVEARDQQMKDYISVHVQLKELFMKLDTETTGFLTGQVIQDAIKQNTGGIKDLMQLVGKFCGRGTRYLLRVSGHGTKMQEVALLCDEHLSSEREFVQHSCCV